MDNPPVTDALPEAGPTEFWGLFIPVFTDTVECEWVEITPRTVPLWELFSDITLLPIANDPSVIRSAPVLRFSSWYSNNADS